MININIKKDRNFDEKLEFVIDAVNEVVSALPPWHENRNSFFAKSLLFKTMRLLEKENKVSYNLALETVKSICGKSLIS